MDQQREKIIKGYVEFELLNGRAPNSVFELTKKLKLDETVFYHHFGSLELLRKAVLTELMVKTNEVLDSDENYDGFTGREKMLAVFFTLFEQMQSQRSYLLARYGELKKTPEFSSDWKEFLKLLIERADAVYTEAREKAEIQDRHFIGDHYAKGVPVMFMYIFRVWVKDDSAEFATTDAAIEKTVNMSFDVLGSNPLDSLIDFGKFAFKTKVI